MHGTQDPMLSLRVPETGLHHLRTMRSATHFLEIQFMEQVYEQELAKEIQLFEGRLTVIYSGSRGTFSTRVSQVFSRLFTERAWL